MRRENKDGIGRLMLLWCHMHLTPYHQNFFSYWKEYQTTGYLSIHNQETAAENEFFERGTGDFEAMYQRMGVPKTEAHGTGENAIRYHLPQMPVNRTLLVHNTFTSQADVDFALAQHKDLYWCLCPNANLYIEIICQKLPCLCGHK